jgi:inosine-uridine nucleoside N-ribohydrolase
MRWRCWTWSIRTAGVPVSCGDPYPVDGHFVFPVPWQEDMDRLSGVDVTPSSRRADERHAVDLLHDTLAAAEAPVTLLATGPLTNIAQWLARHPDDRAGVERLVIMGGALDVPGNIIVPGFTDDHPEHGGMEHLRRPGRRRRGAARGPADRAGRP